MKLAFVGKGGSGKTTISALISRHLASASFPVLTIDADINQHLGRTLGMNEKEASTLPPLGVEIARLKEYLRGTNPLIPDNESMIKTTPPSAGSRFLKVIEDNPIYKHFSRVIDSVRLMAVGEFSEEDLGVRCYHSKTGAVELLLNHMLDKEKEYVVVDMTAGADSFASGLFTRFDVTFLVVEPTLKSVSVYKQYEQYAKDYGVVIKVIGNKVADESDIEFIKEHVGDALVAIISLSSFVKKADRGEVLPLSELEPENHNALKNIAAVVDAQKKDWRKFYQQAVEFHIRNAKSWANAAAGKDLTAQIDPHFVLQPEILSSC
jgi:CO dehydrogenase maturation factor